MAKPELLVSHYQKTHEVTLEMWKQRNRLFLYLLIVVGVASFLALGPQEAHSLLVDMLAKILDISDNERIDELRTSFPYNLIQTLLLIVVFYLMVNLYHRSRFVIRNYMYLGFLEKEIRQELKLSKADAAFTRESRFYWRTRDSLAWLVKWAFFILLGGLLALFLGSRIVCDVTNGEIFFIIVDLAAAALIVVFYVGYIFSSVRLEQESQEMSL